MRAIVEKEGLLVSLEILDQAGLPIGSEVDVSTARGVIEIVGLNTKSNSPATHTPIDGKWVGSTENPLDAIIRDREDRLDFLINGDAKVQE